PRIGMAAVQVLLHNDVQVVAPPLRCCGRAHLDAGDLPGAAANMRANVAALHAYVKRGYTVVCPQPSCSLHLKRTLPWLVATPEAERTAAAVRDLGEYLLDLHGAGRLETGFGPGRHRYLYHHACRLRAQDAPPGSALLRLLPQAAVQETAACSGMDGLWGLMRENFDASIGLAAEMIDQVDGARDEVVVCDCSQSALQLEQLRGRPARHTIEVIRDAYGLSVDGRVPDRKGAARG
ncbi:MAG: hypothetical protein GF355_16330, partial [Candidatus Eisenbacteria bacterium]|nr:hypothetical protein [Candidatus Eisenbacteria bacterium]